MVLAALGAEQAELPESVPVSHEAIVQAVEQLGAPQFSVRRQASRYLWRAGLAAEPALRRAAQEPDREVRLRAQLILDDFRYGILPDVPDEVNVLIRQFRDGDTTQRFASLQALADRDDFERLQRLIRLEPDGNIRRTLLVYLMRSSRAVEYFQELERLDELVAAVGADQDAAWRQTTLAQMLFSEGMIRRLAELENLQVLVKVVQREPSADIRREMLSRLFENAAAVASLVEQDQLDLALKLIEMEPQRRSRSQWIVQMVAMPQAIKQLVEKDRLDAFLAFARENAEADQQATILQRAVQHPDVVQAIMKKSGVDGLIGMSAVETDPAARGKLLAAIVASAGVRQALNEGGQRDLILQLATKQEPAAMRNEYMKGILASGYGYSLFQQPDSRKALWELIKVASPEADLALKDWRGEAIYRLMTMSSSDEIFREETELKWLLGFLDDQVTDEQRLRLLQRVLVDYRLQRVMNGVQYFEPLLALVKRTPDNQRGALLGRLIALTTVERLAAADQIGRVVALAREETSAESRAAYLENLFCNHAAMASLIAAERYDELWQLVVEEQDAVRHASLRGDFYSTSAVVTRLQEKEQLDTLVEFARGQTVPAARRQYLVRLFRNLQAMTLLIDRKHYETLYGMARDDTDNDERATLLSAFYVNPRVLQQLAADKQIDQVLGFAEQQLSGNSLRTFLQQICQHDTTIAAIVAQGQLDKTIELIRQQKEDYYQSYLMRMVLTSPRVVEHYGAADKLKELFATISEISVNTRYQVWDGLLQRAENVAVVVKQRGLDDLMAQIGQLPQAQQRGQLIGRLMSHQPVIEHWIADKGLAHVFELVRAQDDAQSRQNLLRMLFSSEAAIGALLKAGAFDELYELVSREDNQQRSQLLAQLLTNGKMVEHLIAAKRVDRLIQVAGQQSDVEIRRQVLTQILASPAAVAALIEADCFSQLLKLCRLDSDASARRQLLVNLLESRQAVERLAATEELEPVIREILGETEEESRRALLQSLLGRPETLSVLIDRGMFGELLKIVDAEDDPEQRRQLLLPLLNDAKAIRQLATRGRIPELLQLAADEIQASGNVHLLYAVFNNAAAIQALIESGGLDKLLGWADREEFRGYRTQVLTGILNSPAAMAYLIKHGQMDRLGSWLDRQADLNVRRQVVQRLLYDETGQTLLAEREVAEWLVVLLELETDANFRHSNANALLTRSRIRQHLIAHGHADVLRQAVAWLPEEGQRMRLRQLVDSPSGLVAYHVKRGEDEQAEQLLVEQADDDLGRLRLAAYWWTSGRIDEQIDAVRRRWEQNREPGDARLLVYLHRADGDLDAAHRIAQGLADPGLEKVLLVEMRRWADAAVMQDSHLCPLPIPWTGAGPVPALHQQIEQQGLTAVYQRLAGDVAAFDKTMEQVVQTAAAQPDDTTLQWLCVEALLLNGRVDQGLEHLAGYDLGRAFDLLSVRHQYRDALRLLGWEDGKPLDADWIASLPTRSLDGTPQIIERLDTALKVVRLLQSLGRREESLAALDLLETYARNQPDDNTSNSTRKLCVEPLSRAMVALGQPQRAWDLLAEITPHPDSPPFLLSRWHMSRYGEASAWWIWLRELHPQAPVAETFAQLHGVLNPSAEEDPEEFERLVQHATRQIRASETPASEASYLAVARAYIARDLLDRAEEVLLGADPQRIETLAIQADLSWRRGRWDEAAERFERLWQMDNDRLADLFLAGESLRRAGRQAESEQRKLLVHRLAIDSRARFQLARSLLERAAADEKMGQAPSGQRDSQNLRDVVEPVPFSHGGGLKGQAAEQCRAILRTAPLEHLEWHEATRLLGEHLMDTDPGTAAEWFELSTLDDLRTYFHLLQLPTYLRTPAVIDRLRAAAAIEAGDFETAKQLARAALAAVPAEIDISEDLVPRLEAAGRRDLADELFDEQFQAHVQWCADWPDSAMLHNNLAWLAARCGRRLDDALRHAQRAVELDPTAAHLDTLAEVHFRRGDRERAVEYSEQAVALDPRNQTLRSQLDRFRATGP